MILLKDNDMNYCGEPKKWSQSIRFRAGVLAAALLLGLGACSTDPNTRKIRYLASGEQFYKEGKYQEAALQFRNAVQLDPKSAEARHRLARAYLNLNNPAAAYSELMEAVTLQPSNWDAQLDLASLEIARREFDEAGTRIAAVLEADPDNALAHATLGMKYAVTEETAKAVVAFEKAIALAPERVDFYTGLGRTVYQAAGKVSEAEAVFKKAAAANPNSANAHLELARFYLAQNRPEGEAAARAAMQLAPKDITPRLLLARVFRATGRPAEAASQLRELKSIAPENPQAYRALGLFYEEGREREKAIQEFQSVLAAKPADLFVKQRLIDNLIEVGKFKEAESLNQEVLKATKDNAPAFFDQGRILLAQEQLQDASTAFQKAAVLAPNNAQIHYLLGTTQVKLGLPALARTSFAKALELEPTMTGAAVALAGLAVSGGDQKTALQITGKALALDPGSLSAQVARAQALLASGDLRQSEAILLDVLSREPASTTALMFLTSIRARQGRIKEMINRVAPLVQQQPKNAGLRFVLAFAHHLSGDSARAEAEAQEALKLDAKTPRIHLLLAAIYISTGKREPAKLQLRAAIESDPRNVDNYILLASQYENEKNWDEAKKLYERARQIDPNSPVLANQLAYLYLEQGGDLNIAFNLAQQAMQQMPNSPQVADTLGWAYYKRGMADQAITHIRRCVEAFPSNYECQYHLGMAYKAAGDPRAAEKHLQLALKEPDAAFAEQARQALREISQVAR